MRLGRLMHVEDMHTRRNLRMLLIRFQEAPPVRLPEELELTVRERNGDSWLLEHRGELIPLIAWLGTQDLAEIAIGTEDLRGLYDRYHGPNAVPLADEVPA